jgi:acetyl esterase
MLPEVKALLERVAQADTPEIIDMPTQQARLAYEASCALLDKKGPAVETVLDFDIPSPHGAIGARLYDPTPGDTQPCKALVYYHGGGFMIGSPASHDGFVRRLVAGLGIPAISIDYRMAPEHPFPAAIDDCITATQWAATQLGSALGRDVDGLVIAGDSAGGNAASVVANELRETGGAPIVLQALLYPAADYVNDYPSRTAHGEGKLLETKAMDFFEQANTPPGTDMTDPRISPMFAQIAPDAPPAIVIVAELDPLRDEGAAYAQKLAAAGVPTIFREEMGLIHGFYTLRGALPAGDACTDVLIADIQRRLAQHKA